MISQQAARLLQKALCLYIRTRVSMTQGACQGSTKFNIELKLVFCRSSQVRQAGWLCADLLAPGCSMLIEPYICYSGHPFSIRSLQTHQNSDGH